MINNSDGKGKSRTINHKDDNSLNSSFVSGNNRLTAGLDDRKEDDWEKLSRISKRTVTTKKAINLDSIDEKIKSLHTMEVEIAKKKQHGSLPEDSFRY